MSRIVSIQIRASSIDRVAIRVARVVDEPRLVAVHRRVDHDVVVDREQKRVMALVAVVGIPRVGLRRRQRCARVLDQSRASGNRSSQTPLALNRRRPDLESR